MVFAKFIENVVRSRAARLILAFGLLILSGWAFLPYATSRVASSAFVNAELVRVATPIAGRLANDLPHKGDFISHTHLVNLVETLSPDQRHLSDLRRQHTVAKERAELASTQLEEIKTADRVLAGRADAYRAGMVKRIGREIEEAKVEKAGCLAEAHQRRDVGARMEALAKLGTSSQIRTAEALAWSSVSRIRRHPGRRRIGSSIFSGDPNKFDFGADPASGFRKCIWFRLYRFKIYVFPA